MIHNQQTEKIYCLAFTFRQALRFAIGVGLGIVIISLVPWILLFLSWMFHIR